MLQEVLMAADLPPKGSPSGDDQQRSEEHELDASPTASPSGPDTELTPAELIRRAADMPQVREFSPEETKVHKDIREHASDFTEANTHRHSGIGGSLKTEVRSFSARNPDQAMAGAYTQLADRFASPDWDSAAAAVPELSHAELEILERFLAAADENTVAARNARKIESSVLATFHDEEAQRNVAFAGHIYDASPGKTEERGVDKDGRRVRTSSTSWLSASEDYASRFNLKPAELFVKLGQSFATYAAAAGSEAEAAFYGRLAEETRLYAWRALGSPNTGPVSIDSHPAALKVAGELLEVAINNETDSRSPLNLFTDEVTRERSDSYRRIANSYRLLAGQALGSCNFAT